MTTDAVTTGAVIAVALGALELAKVAVNKISAKRNGNGNGKQALACALDHKKLAGTMDRLGDTMNRQTDILDVLTRHMDDLHRWHATEIPGQPGQKKIWHDTYALARDTSRNVRTLCRTQGLDPVED